MADEPGSAEPVIQLGEVEDTEPVAVPPPVWRRRYPFGALVLGVVAALLLGVVGTLVVRDQMNNPAGMFSGENNSAPVVVPSRTVASPSAEELAFIKQLKPASRDLEAAVSVTQSREDARVNLFPVYIATGDLTLPSKPLSRPIAIAVPAGYRWVAGPLNNIGLVFANTFYGPSDMQWAYGDLVFDPLCAAPITGEVASDVCGNPAKQVVPTTVDTSHLRKVTLSQLWRDHPSIPSTVGLAGADVIYVATGPVVLKPDMVGPKKTAVILVDIEHGGRIVGGRFGRNQVATVGDYSGSWQPEHGWVYDPVYHAAVSGLVGYCKHFSAQVQRLYYQGACTA